MKKLTSIILVCALLMAVIAVPTALLFDDWTNVAYAAINVKSTLSAETFTSEDGTKLPYRFYKPDDYSETNSYKLLLLLHGKDERGMDNEAQVARRDAMPFVQKILADKQLKKQYFIVVPQCSTTDVWANVAADGSYAYNADEQTAAQKAVFELLMDIVKKYSVDMARLYVTGYDNGAYGVYDMLARYPGLFAAALPMSGGADVNQYKAAEETALWAFHSADDVSGGYGQNLAMVRKLESIGAGVLYTEFKTVGHNAWKQGYTNENAFEWMDAQCRRNVYYQRRLITPDGYTPDNTTNGKNYTFLRNVAKFGAHKSNVMAPTGGGDKDLFKAMTDGLITASYDTYTGDYTDHDDYFGYEFASNYTFKKVVFTSGTVANGGGLFGGGAKVQALVNGQWTDVVLTGENPYPVLGNGEAIDIETYKGFTAYTFEFEPIQANGIRIVGKAGGNERWTSVSEMEVYAESTVLDGNMAAIGAPNVDEVWQWSTDYSKGRDITLITNGVLNDSFDNYGWNFQHDTGIYYTYNDLHSFNKLVYTEGQHWDEGGGWFAEGVTIKVRKNGVWTAVELEESSSDYPVVAQEEKAPFDGFVTYTFNFNATEGDAVGIFGKAGGNQHFVSCAELAVYSADVSPYEEPTVSVKPFEYWQMATNVTYKGTAIVSETNPQGIGSRDYATVMNNGFYNAAGDSYNTYNGDFSRHDAWFGYTFAEEQIFNSLIYQVGTCFDGGGMFAGGARIQVRVNGVWTDVPLTTSNPYPVLAEGAKIDINQHPGYEIYQFFFAPTKGDGVRVIGSAGGDQHWSSVAELVVFAVENVTDGNVSGTALPMASTAPNGSSCNPDLGVIVDGETSGGNKNQYDTYQPNKTACQEWYALSFGQTHTFTQLRFTEGMHFAAQGGWFSGGVKVQACVDGVWKDVELTTANPYPVIEGTADIDESLYSAFTTYVFDFKPITATAVRIVGNAGGLSYFTSCAELSVTCTDVDNYEGKLSNYKFVYDNSVTYTDEKIRDLIEAGWLGQMYGVVWGAPIEFSYKGRMVPDEEIPDRLSLNLNDAFAQDDLYVELPFINALNTEGIDVSVETLGDYFRDTAFPLWHGNDVARTNLNAGIPAPLSGSYLYNSCCDDIDWQIEADFVGMMNPGAVNRAVDLGFRYGHVIGYGDGAYGGSHVSAMHAKAYVAKNVTSIVVTGIQSVPKGTKYRAILDDVYDMYVNDVSFVDAWQRVEDKWVGDDRCPREGFGPTAAFNIDAKLAGGYIVMGLLYGLGDVEESMRLAIKCGQDNDCTPSTIGSILGNYYGTSVFRKSLVNKIDYNNKFLYTDDTLHTSIDKVFELAKLQIVQAGGKVENGVWTMPEEQEIVTPEVEQWPDMPSMDVSLGQADKNVTGKVVSYHKDGIESVTWDFGDGTIMSTKDSVQGNKRVTAGEQTKEIKPIDKNKTYNILFIGNSYTYYNHMTGMFKRIAESMGYSVDVDQIVHGGHRLGEYADPNDNANTGDYDGSGKDVYAALTGNKKYDYVFIQEYDAGAMTSTSNFDVAATTLVQLIRQHGATPVLYETCGKHPDDYWVSKLGTTNFKMTWDIARANQQVADKLNVAVSYAGRATYLVFQDNKVNNIDLYHTDLNHPSFAGSYLIALTHFATVFGCDPTEVKYVPTPSDDIITSYDKTCSTVGQNITLEVASTLKQAAKDAVFFTPQIPSSYEGIESGTELGGTYVNVNHTYKLLGNYTVTLTIVGKNGTVATRKFDVNITLSNNLASVGTPIVSVEKPEGVGSKDIGVICDGVYGNGNSTQYDTYKGVKTNDYDYFGYLFAAPQVVNTVEYTAGTYFANGGGWFANGDVKIQALLNGIWTDVALTNDPGYPVGDDHTMGKQYATYIFKFADTTCDGIRIYGRAGGPQKFASCSELKVFGVVTPSFVADNVDVKVNDGAKLTFDSKNLYVTEVKLNDAVIDIADYTLTANTLTFDSAFLDKHIGLNTVTLVLENGQTIQTTLNVATDGTKLANKITQAKAINGDKYTDYSFDMLQQAIVAAETIAAKQGATQAEIDNAVEELQAAINSLVSRETAARAAFTKAVNDIAQAKSKAEMFDKINATINAYKQVTDKAAVAEDYAKLQAAVGAYNEYVTTVNTEVTTANDVATKVFVTAGGVTAVLACVYVAIKKLLGGAL